MACFVNACGSNYVCKYYELIFTYGPYIRPMKYSNLVCSVLTFWNVLLLNWYQGHNFLHKPTLRVQLKLTVLLYKSWKIKYLVLKRSQFILAFSYQTNLVYYFPIRSHFFYFLHCVKNIWAYLHRQYLHC